VLLCGRVCCCVAECVAVWQSVLLCGRVCCCVAECVAVCCKVHLPGDFAQKARKVRRRRVRPPTAPRVCVAVSCSVNLGKISHTRARKVRRGGARPSTAFGCVLPCVAWCVALPCVAHGDGNTLLHTATYCTTLHCSRCNTAPHTASRWNIRANSTPSSLTYCAHDTTNQHLSH